MQTKHRQMQQVLYTAMIIDIVNLQTGLTFQKAEGIETIITVNECS